MPAIQPEQLERQIDDLLTQVDDPSRFTRSCMNLLDFYADRTKRPRGSSASVEIAQVLRVPRPVMKSICVRIAQSAQGQPQTWLTISRRLWEEGIREARQVAACALGKSPQEKIPELVEDWAITCEDDYALNDVTSMGLKMWRSEDLERFYDTIARWLADPRVRIRHLAILALIGRLEDEDFKEVPQMLNMLGGLSARLRGSSQRSLVSLIRNLVEISSPEVAKHLIEEIKSNVEGAERLAQNALSAFPGHLQDEIGGVL